MKFNNVRINHATNSSSTHSVLITNQQYRDIDSVGELQFGWNEFVAASDEAKQNYIFAQLWENLGFIPPVLRRTYIKELTGIDCNPIDPDYIQQTFSVGVDHQSRWTIPLKRGMWYDDYKEIHDEFVSELTAYLMKNDIIVVGGNDNDEYQTSYEGTPAFPEYFDFNETGQDSLLTYKDGDWWIFYNSKTGFKTTFSFKDNPTPRTKSVCPELIDLSITEKCKFGNRAKPGDGVCYFCYQSSKVDGKHADTKQLLNFINYNLSHIEGLCECAIGGGDPTEHPDFIKILQAFKKNEITANFSTKNVKWCIDNWEQIESLVGTIGISVSESDVRNMTPEIQYLQHIGAKIAIHIIPELINHNRFDSIMEDIIKLKSYGTSFICLGLKHKGNMLSLPKWRQDCINTEYKSDLSKFIKAHKQHYITWSFDTCLAREMESELIELEINPKSYYTEEGKFSCYVDAVNWKMSKSSYDDESVGCCNMNTEQFIKQYQKY